MILLNGKPINVTIFPDGTSQVWKLSDEYKWLSDDSSIVPEFGSLVIDFYWEGQEGELFHLFQLLDLIAMCHWAKVVIRMPYLPYGRQDKTINNKHSFALSTFLRILANFQSEGAARTSCGQIKFEVIDVHNPDIFKNPYWTNYYPQSLINIVQEHDYILYPDKGASRYSKLFPEMESGYCNKVRDQQTGWITDYTVPDVDLSNKRVIVVDDICDGGATFEFLAETVKAKEINLCVTHGIFSKGLATLSTWYNRIFTSDTRFYGIDLLKAKQQSSYYNLMYELMKVNRFAILPTDKLVEFPE